MLEDSFIISESSDIIKTETFCAVSTWGTKLDFVVLAAFHTPYMFQPQHTKRAKLNDASSCGTSYTKRPKLNDDNASTTAAT